MAMYDFNNDHMTPDEIAARDARRRRERRHEELERLVSQLPGLDPKFDDRVLQAELEAYRADEAREREHRMAATIATEARDRVWAREAVERRVEERRLRIKQLADEAGVDLRQAEVVLGRIEADAGRGAFGRTDPAGLDEDVAATEERFPRRASWLDQEMKKRGILTPIGSKSWAARTNTPSRKFSMAARSARTCSKSWHGRSRTPMRHAQSL